MVELELDPARVVSPDRTISRKTSYRPSMSGRVEARRKLATHERLSFAFEWVANPSTYPTFLKEIAKEWIFSPTEDHLHRVLAGVALWENFYCDNRDNHIDVEDHRLAAQQIPQYVIERINPDLRTLFYSFQGDLGGNLLRVSTALENAIIHIEQAYSKGVYRTDTDVYMDSSPFLPLYRGNAPLQKLYEAVVLKKHLINPYTHSYFPNKDHSFFGWLMRGLKDHYQAIAINI